MRARTRANIKERQHRRILHIFFLPADASRTGVRDYDRAFDGCIWSDLFITPTGNTVLHLVQALQHYKFSAVQPGNLRRIIAGHKKIWPFDKRDRAAEKGRGRARKGEQRTSYVRMYEFVSMSLLAPPGLRESSRNILSSSFPFASFSFSLLFSIGSKTRYRCGIIIEIIFVNTTAKLL